MSRRGLRGVSIVASESLTLYNVERVFRKIEMQPSKSQGKKVVLAYSGGLDTSVAIRWLQERYGFEVIAVSVDVGQPGNLDEDVKRAKIIGAMKAYAIDAKEEFVKNYIFPSLKANAMYEGSYPLSTAIARPLIVKKLVEVAEKEGSSYIAHGCTAKGNDQVRFDVSIGALAPHIEIIAPMREWVMSREEEIEYARMGKIPIKVKRETPYSTDENLWGRSAECGILEDAAQEPPEDAYEWTTNPTKGPEKPEYVEIGFEGGVPISLNGKVTKPVSLIKSLNETAGRHGVGRIDHIENRLVGIKSREIYECPAATVLIGAHIDLEKLVLPRDLQSFKRIVEQRFTELAYDGLWFSPLRESLSAFVEKTQDVVSGTVRVRLHKGCSVPVGRSSPYALYSTSLATYDKGDKFDHTAAKGFIYVWGLPLKTIASVQGSKVKSDGSSSTVVGKIRKGTK
jgi:argininosuccinate synthase